MKKVFGYGAYDDAGEMILSTYTNEYSDMLMDVRVYKLQPGDVKTFNKAEEETAVLLLAGNIVYTFDGSEYPATRTNVFEEGPYCVHVAKGNAVSVTAKEESEILVQSTKNDKAFASKFYTPADAPYKYSAVGKYGNVAKRQVNTIFDLDIAPESNMVLGEVLNDRGNWSGFLPHSHPQPELYYFLFDREEGFGASFVGDDVYKSVDKSFAAIPGGELHPQAVAPGYRMYTVWMIRHLDGQPWHQTDRNEDERYIWQNDTDFGDNTAV